MFSPHVSNIRRASTTIDSVSERRFLIIERIDFSPEFALYQYLHWFFYIGPTGGHYVPGYLSCSQIYCKYVGCSNALESGLNCLINNSGVLIVGPT